MPSDIALAATAGVFSGGTVSGNPMTMAAGIAVLGYMREHQGALYPYLNEQGDRLAREVNGSARSTRSPPS